MNFDYLKPVIAANDQRLTFRQLVGLLNQKEKVLKRQFLSNKNVSWKEAEQVYNSFSNSEKGKIRSSGQQLLQGYYNPSTETLDPPKTPPTTERGIMIVQMYLQQEALCNYTGCGPYHILDFSVEHIDPSVGDYPNNITLVLANVNGNRKKSSLENFIARQEETYYSMGGDEIRYNKWYDENKKKIKEGHLTKKKIMSMNYEELGEAWKAGKIKKKDEK